MAVNADPVALELAATAAFLKERGCSDAWAETAKRKPQKARAIEETKRLYEEFRQITTPQALPKRN